MDRDEKQLIEKVTENNDKPAPGWALDQLSRLTVVKASISEEMGMLLIKRMSKSSTHVKLKALRAVHFISRRGGPHFRRTMQNQSQIIRGHLRASPPRPARSALPLPRIRAAAPRA